MNKKINTQAEEIAKQVFSAGVSKKQHPRTRYDKKHDREFDKFCWEYDNPKDLK